MKRLINFITKDVTGRDVLIYLLPESINKSHLLEGAVKSGSLFNPSDFGEVIASCYGDMPTQEVLEKIKNYQ
jgi:hypothetical protein